MRKIAIGFGTRPELIKLAPLIKIFQADQAIDTFVFSTGQHENLVNQSKELFAINVYEEMHLPQYLELESLADSLYKNCYSFLKKLNPEMVIVQGDTASTFAITKASFTLNIPVVHIEAGLRSYNLQSPFPEEGYRTEITKMSSIHFAPTENNLKNLKKDGVDKNIFKVGNTGLDSLKALLEKQHLEKRNTLSKQVLITIHRRENLNSNLELYLQQLNELAKKHSEYKFIFPIHPNPIIHDKVKRICSDIENIHLVDPLSYVDFIKLLLDCDLVISDSGGLQEETSYLDIPMILIRDFADRNEINSHSFFMQLKSSESLLMAFNSYLENVKSKKAINPDCPYGNGTSSQQIYQILKSKFS